MADVLFDSYAFLASGAPSAGARTMPNRLNDIINVKDWGAVGDNSHDDTTNIQNAINYCITNGGGIVYFPAGDYKVTANLVVGHAAINVGVRLVGSGRECCSVAAYISSGGLANDCLEAIERIGSFSCTLTRPHAHIVECTAFCGGPNNVAIDASKCLHAFIRDTHGSGPMSSQPANSANPGFQGQGNPIWMALGASCIAMGCRCQTGGADPAFALSGVGAALIACSGENHGTVVRVGWGPDPVTGVPSEQPAIGCTVMGLQVERSNCQIDLYNARGCYLAGNYFYGADGVPSPYGPISNMTWSAGTATVTTNGNHNIPAGTHTLILEDNNTWNQAGTIFIVATVTGPTTFTYPLAVAPAAFTSSLGWNYPLPYQLRCRKVYETVIIGGSMSGSFSVAGVDLDYNGQADHQNNVIENMSPNNGWLLPGIAGGTSSTKNLAGWKFINCGGSVQPFGVGAQNSHPDGFMKLSDLPGQGTGQPGPFEGQEYSVSDGNNATFGGVQTVPDPGAGTGKYKVRWNVAAAGWIRVG